MDKLKGKIERVTYYNEETGYGVVKVSVDYNDETLKKYINTFFSNIISVTCLYDRMPLVDEEYEYFGSVDALGKWGPQFKAESFERKNASLSGVVAYLSSDMFVGVGEKIAKKIYNALGSNCLDLIIEDRSALDGIKISEALKDNIYNILKENKEKEKEILGLLSLGLTMKMALRITGAIPKDAYKKIKQNPYMLIDLVEGIGFIRADNIALNNGIKPDSLIRITAYINYYLREYLNRTGDTYIQEARLIDELFATLNKTSDLITKETYEKGLKNLVKDKKIYIDSERNIFAYSLHNYENIIANFISDLLKKESKKCFNDKNIDVAMSKLKTSFNIEYSEKQEDAIKSALKENISIITGGPGTGKTTIIKGIIEGYIAITKKDLARERILLLAPTGRAAKRLTEVTHHPAQTIHKALGYSTFGFSYDANNKLECEMVIVDEFSMVDTSLASHLFSALDENTKVVLVGDVNQLPSIGPGEVLANLIESKEITTTILDKIHRQARDSSIISFAHSINQGFIPDDILEKKKDRTFNIIYHEYIANNIVSIIKKALEKGLDIVRDIQVLIPIYRGKNGIDSVNKLVQEVVNPKHGIEINRQDYTFREGDKVIQLVNRSDKGVMNGDIGYIKSIEKFDTSYKVKVSFDIGDVEYESDELTDLKLAYAISIHKSQGSEFSCAIVPFSQEYRYMLRRKLIYTAVTRAKDYLIMLGSIEALSIGVEGIEERRKTKLLEKIKQALSCEKLEITLDDSDISPFDFME